MHQHWGFALETPREMEGLAFTGMRVALSAPTILSQLFGDLLSTPEQMMTFLVPWTTALTCAHPSIPG